MDRNYTYLILTINAIAAVYFYIKKKAEVPLFLVLFNIFVEYRLVSLQLGFTDWVSFEYVIPFKWNFDIAFKVSDLILLGNSIMIYGFMIFYKPAKKINDSNELLNQFVLKNKKNIIYGLVFFSVLSAIIKGSDGGYATLTKLGTSSFIMFFFLLIRANKNQKTDVKLVYIITFLFLSYLTYDTALRFQFLGWMIPIGYYLVRNVKPAKKLTIAVVGIFTIMIVFSAAGVLRYAKMSEITLSNLYKESVDRLKIADDINFIDGFMMMYQVYPDELPYGYGQEHLNIILRPVPRSLWPGKPLASWVRNVEARHGWVNEDSAGFSPTVWGVFYAEGGTVGVIIFSILWALALAFIYRALSYFTSDLSAFLVGMLLVSMIPIFRSGDMAGDFAIALMSFWPMMIFTSRYKKFVKKQLQQQNAG